MMPTADEIATAIVAAARETGASPVDVLKGADREPGCPVRDSRMISRARAYAGRAIDKVFNRPEIGIPTPSIARLVGTNKPSWGSFFASLEARSLPWWDNAAFARVVNAIMDCPEPSQAESPAPSPEPEPEPAKPEPPPYKHGPLPPLRYKPARQDAGTLEADGYRPPPGTIARVVLQDDEDDDAPIFDRSHVGQALGGPRTVAPPRTKRQMMDDLAAAVRNTAKATPEPESGNNGDASEETGTPVD